MKTPLDRSEVLSTKNKWYRNILREFWDQQMKWDGHDLTSRVLFSEEIHATAIITAKSDGILAGSEEVEFFLECEQIEGEFQKQDGDRISKGDVILELSGEGKQLLKAERILLNFLSRLSGIATLARKGVDQIQNDVVLLPTRKTLWGPIDKKGATIGGCGTHRLALFDAVLVKENHLALLSNGINSAAEQISMAENVGGLWEIEIETEEELMTLLKNLPEKKPGVIMLDNFSADTIRDLLGRIQKPEGIYFEASGGITLETIAEYANTGVDALSAGFLTNAVVPVDYSMRILKS